MPSGLCRETYLNSLERQWPLFLILTGERAVGTPAGGAEIGEADMLEGNSEQGRKGALQLTLPKSQYSHDVLLRTAHLFSDRCYVRIVDGADAPAVEISSKGPECDLEQIAKDFHNELIDQELREHIRNETQHIQEMIVREAFAPLDATSEED